MDNDYLQSVRKQFAYYKLLAERTFMQVSDLMLHWQYNEESNSIAIIVKHLSGNMLSRWTNFLTEDGEKESRRRDAEFENDITSRKDMMEKWNEGWDRLFAALDHLTTDDLSHIVYIRKQGHTVTEAINRQLAHYSYHVGQIVFIGKMVSEQWKSLSIPKNGSDNYNNEKFSQRQPGSHFKDEFLNEKDHFEG